MNDTYKYYIIYLHEKYAKKYSYSHNIFAYTCDKKIKKEFEKVRNMKMFYIKKRYLTKEEIKYLFDMDSSLLLLNYNFGDGIEFPITHEEKGKIEYIGNRVSQILLPITATISPWVFNKTVRKVLKKINYTDNWFYYMHGGKGTDLKPNLLKIFLRQYGNTISLEDKI